MITGVDHVVLLCPALEAGSETVRCLLGRREDWRSRSDEGSASAMFQLDHIALEVLAPAGRGVMADRLLEILDRDGPGLQTVVFASDDIEADHHRMTGCGLEPAEITAGRSTDLATGRLRRWRRFRLNDERTGGIRIFVLQREADDPLRPAGAADDGLHDLDHLVITSGNAARALDFFGTRLGLECLLDRDDQERGSRLLVFRAGESGIEVACRRDQGVGVPDRLWGITWKTRDIDAANRRLGDKGLNVSAVRDGLRRGTRVFSVRDGSLGVPTLVVAGNNRPDPFTESSTRSNP
jgi:catechol 2,3-dioxygenase-like lactoylglutathione lyase family enzyme